MQHTNSRNSGSSGELATVKGEAASVSELSESQLVTRNNLATVTNQLNLALTNPNGHSEATILALINCQTELMKTSQNTKQQLPVKRGGTSASSACAKRAKGNQKGNLKGDHW